MEGVAQKGGWGTEEGKEREVAVGEGGGGGEGEEEGLACALCISSPSSLHNSYE